jgi:predicted unusual protein kinase regulating ubiquinone biosynthesis (AarF/ABC1/UbiB family)
MNFAARSLKRLVAGILFTLALAGPGVAWASEPRYAWLDGPLDAYAERSKWEDDRKSRIDRLRIDVGEAVRLDLNALGTDNPAVVRAEKRFEALARARGGEARGTNALERYISLRQSSKTDAERAEVDAIWDDVRNDWGAFQRDGRGNETFREYKRMLWAKDADVRRRLDALIASKYTKPAPTEDEARGLKQAREFRAALDKALPRDFLATGSSAQGQALDHGFFVEMLTHGFLRLAPADRERMHQQLTAANAAREAATRPSKEADLSHLSPEERKQIEPLLDAARKIDATARRSAPEPGVVIRKVLAGLGPGFTKLGQMLANRPDLVDAKYRAELAKLSDEATKVPFAEIRSTLASSLRPNLTLARAVTSGPRTKLVDAIFRSIDPEPIGVGSIGQTHFATLQDGHRVAIKVLKPGAKEALFENLTSMETVLGARQDRGTKAYLALVREIRRLSVEETDLRHEAATIHEMQPLLERDGVLVPKVYDHLSSERVLVEDIALGDKVKKAAFGPELAPKVADRIMLSLLRQVLVYGRFHDDPHEGNLFVDEKGTVTFIDWGLNSKISARERLSLGKLVTSIGLGWKGTAEGTARELATGLSPAAVRQSVERAMKGTGSAFDRTQDLLMDLQHQGAELPPALVQASKALMLADGVARKVDSTWEPSRGVAAFRRDLLARPVAMFKGAKARPADPELDALEAEYVKVLVGDLGVLDKPLLHGSAFARSEAHAQLGEIMNDPVMSKPATRPARETARASLAKKLVEELAEQHAVAVAHGKSGAAQLEEARTLEAHPNTRPEGGFKEAFDAALQKRLAATSGEHARAPEAAALKAALANRQRYQKSVEPAPRYQHIPALPNGARP